MVLKMIEWTRVTKSLPPPNTLLRVARTDGKRFIGKLAPGQIWLYPDGTHAYYMRKSDKWGPLDDED